MADVNKLSGETRTEFGKGAARRIRRADRVPAVLYGHGIDPIHLSLPGHETLLALRTANALLEITIDGDTKLALPKQVQRDPIKGFIKHVDLLLVRRGEKVSVEVPLVIVGDSAPDTLVVADQQTILLEAPATSIPDEITVSVEGLEAGAQIFAKDLDLPEGVVFNGEPDDLMVGVNQAVEQDLGEEDEEAGDEDEEAAEPEADNGDDE